jgi:hypothetical protein
VLGHPPCSGLTLIRPAPVGQALASRGAALSLTNAAGRPGRIGPILGEATAGLTMLRSVTQRAAVCALGRLVAGTHNRIGCGRQHGGVEATASPASVPCSALRTVYKNGSTWNIRRRCFYAHRLTDKQGGAVRRRCRRPGRAGIKRIPFSLKWINAEPPPGRVYESCDCHCTTWVCRRDPGGGLVRHGLHGRDWTPPHRAGGAGTVCQLPAQVRG